jgi:hypothetical protein
MTTNQTEDAKRAAKIKARQAIQQTSRNALIEAMVASLTTAQVGEILLADGHCVQDWIADGDGMVLRDYLKGCLNGTIC